MSFKDLLTDKIYVLSRTTTKDDWGVNTETWTVSQTPIQCRVSPITNEAIILSEGLYKDVDYIVFCLPNVDISYDNKIKFNNEIYDIVSIKRDSMSHHLEILIKRNSHV